MGIDFFVKKDHTTEATQEEALTWRLSSFRPSDRREFTRAFSTDEGRKAAYGAVLAYVQGWEKSDWLEEYSVERIGKWFGEFAPSDMIDALLKWVGRRRGSNARRALQKGLDEGRLRRVAVDA